MNIFRNIIYKWKWLSILNSPFKLPQITFYFGKIERGTPYFLPRKWVNLTWEEALDSVVKETKKHIEAYKKAGKTYKIPNGIRFDEKIKERQRSKRAVPVKWQIKSVSLGWKTKWDNYRHEWNPMISITGFNRQFCIYFGLKESMSNMCYWESWLTYHYETDKNKTKTERLKETMKLCNASWGSKDKGYTNYYNNILRKKYLKYIE